MPNLPASHVSLTTCQTCVYSLPKKIGLSYFFIIRLGKNLLDENVVEFNFTIGNAPIDLDNWKNIN